MKAYLRKDEIPDGIATSISGKHEIEIKHGIGYDYMYNQEDDFFLIVDDVLYPETSTAFDFKEEIHTRMESIKSGVVEIAERYQAEVVALSGKADLEPNFKLLLRGLQRDLSNLISDAIENGTMDNQDE